MSLIKARVLQDVNSANSFEYATEHIIFEGGTSTFYFRFFDPTKQLFKNGFVTDYLRYLPNAASTVTVQFNNIDDAVQFTRAATAAFSSDDRSIWQVPILATDNLRGTISLRITLNDNGVIRTVFMDSVLLVENGAGAC